MDLSATGHRPHEGALPGQAILVLVIVGYFFIRTSTTPTSPTSGLTEVKITKILSLRLTMDNFIVDILEALAHAGDLPPDYFGREVDAADLAHVPAMIDETYTIVYVALGYHILVLVIVGYFFIRTL